MKATCIDADPVVLTAGGARCELLPAAAGSLASWTVHGQPLLRPADPAAFAERGAFATGSFPLVPFSNRIAGGQFTWEGRRISLARNFSPEPHAIHGAGFEKAWTVDSADTASARLSLHYTGGAAWPYPFHAEQRYLLGPDALTIEMRATNLAGRAVPLSFGHHPYFPYGGARLTFGAEHVWMTGEDALPSLRVKPFDGFDFSAAAPVARRDIDHCFTGWDGHALIAWEGRAFALEIDASPNLRCAVVYANRERNEFCFEPVAHLNDAINRATEFAMPVVAAGEHFEARIRLRAVPAA